MAKADYFKSENLNLACQETFEHGIYSLIVTPVNTASGYWNYSQGDAFINGVLIATVQRNYSAFPHTFVDHPNGHTYLICGENYQGQTVIELDTGKRLDVMSEHADKGHGFCWSEVIFDAPSRLLKVCGCYWACSYEWKVFRFSDPMSGWPELKVSDAAKWYDDVPPVIMGDLVTTFKLRPLDDDIEYSEVEYEHADLVASGRVAFVQRFDDTPGAVVASSTYRRVGKNELICHETWTSPEETQRILLAEAKWTLYWLKLSEFKATDPLYLRMLAECASATPLHPNENDGIGTCYDGWVTGFAATEQCICRRLHAGKVKDWIFDLEWAAETGPVKLNVYYNGKTRQDLQKIWWEHTPESITAAFTYAKELFETIPKT